MKEAEPNQLPEGLPLFPDSLSNTVSETVQIDPAANSAWSWTAALQVLTYFFPSPQLPSATIGTTEQQRSKAQKQIKGFIVTCSVSTNVKLSRPPEGL